jgi:DNA-binding protein Fis
MSQLSSPSIKQGTDAITANVHATVSESSKSTTLRDAVRETAKEYFLKMDGVTPSNVYELFIAEIEPPLLEIVLQYCRENQSVRHGSTLKNPQQYEQGSEYMTLRWMPYLDSKERGDNSMVIKQELSENVYDKVLQHLSDMVKAILPKSQFSVVCCQLVGYHV